MTPAQVKLAAAAALALLAWWCSRRRPPGARVTSFLDIDANVYSDSFGAPLVDTVVTGGPTSEDENHRRLVELVDESSQAIAEYDRTHPLEVY